eukprot:Plantae.Rhodophyta-Purpureofilum_apyrenoidigerum.ctg43832.p1 GENE.Plantae.Rhodophyta-Purpureofilum_apyrenoidigerum.ctg43832~~Plantae.Rhodophyta-Purpureofilum_apyrenoidigerum.ctg43832.p1  ORF type:complete len:277 (+),score=41.24 Plantae.Rhodophyta-Purpureofilum_apyrenoidigerum.ctg43832:99-833(+)
MSFVSTVGLPRRGVLRSVRPSQHRAVVVMARGGRVLDGPFKGRMGDWYLTQEDVNGVRQYRMALLSAAAASALAVTTALTQQRPEPPTLDVMLLLANASMGIAYWKIHIYMKSMHNLLKTLWGVGTVGAVATLFFSGQGLSYGSFYQTQWLLASGWGFVALTGLFFKEAVCFGRQEALGLTLLTPLLAGGHFLHILPREIENGSAATFAALFVFFALRKFQQPETDDLGDKSIFDHYEREAAAR